METEEAAPAAEKKKDNEELAGGWYNQPSKIEFVEGPSRRDPYAQWAVFVALLIVAWPVVGPHLTPLGGLAWEAVEDFCYYYQKSSRRTAHVSHRPSVRLPTITAAATPVPVPVAPVAAIPQPADPKAECKAKKDWRWSRSGQKCVEERHHRSHGPALTADARAPQEAQPPTEAPYQRPPRHITPVAEVPVEEVLRPDRRSIEARAGQ